MYLLIRLLFVGWITSLWRSSSLLKLENGKVQHANEGWLVPFVFSMSKKVKDVFGLSLGKMFYVQKTDLIMLSTIQVFHCRGWRFSSWHTWSANCPHWHRHCPQSIKLNVIFNWFGVTCFCIILTPLSGGMCLFQGKTGTEREKVGVRAHAGESV